MHWILKSKGALKMVSNKKNRALRQRTQKTFLSLMGLGMLFFYQNCAQAPLEKVPSETTQLSQSAESYDICSTSVVDASNPKYLFVVDMSASNIGDWTEVAGLHYWDKLKATDLLADRLKLIREFVVGSTDTRAVFSVIGFSWDNLQVTRDLSTLGFTTKANALAKIDALIAMQAKTASEIYQCFETTAYEDGGVVFDPLRGYPVRTCGAYSEANYRMNETSYSKALALANEFITTDVGGGSATDNYYTFFISDGIPTDDPRASYAGKCSAGDLQCQRDKLFPVLRNLKSYLSAAGKNLFLYGLFYGDSAQGRSFLEEMVNEVRSGKFFSLAKFTAGGGSAFFDSLISNSTLYEPFTIQVIPLTTVVRNGVVYADSDMDGIIDRDETALGLNPANPRSNSAGILDGIYSSLLKQKLTMPVCTAAEKKFKVDLSGNLTQLAGLTDCDMKGLKLDPTALLAAGISPGVDSDSDGVIDLIEINKGLNARSDEQTLDPDSDGLITINELLKGSDPLQPDANLEANLLNSYTVTQTAAGCDPTVPGRSYQLSVSHLQNTTTLAISGNVPKYLAHEADEGIVFVGYRLVATATSRSETPKTEYRGQYMKIKYLPDGTYKFLSNYEPDFLLLGSR